MRTRTRATGEKGMAIMLTGLLLVPLMTFAAFGVDLASWYSRIGYLQKSADAAALAGTVWMPNLTSARLEANASLRQNGIVDGVDGMEVTIEKGSTSTSLLVEITDTDADRVFSQIFRGKQTLTRSAEAEYNLPLPLGSPLNYFGGDDTKTGLPSVTTYNVTWPPSYTTTPPSVVQLGETAQSYPCNVGTAAVQQVGRWTSASAYDATGFSGSTRCNYAVTRINASGTDDLPPPDFTTRLPNSRPCRVLRGGTGTTYIGRWSNTAYSTTNSGSEAACVWNNSTSGALPSGYNTTATPINRPCRVGYATSQGWWGPNASSPWTASAVGNGTASTLGNRLCRWPAQVQTIVTTPPNPIEDARSPGFWAQIEGPGTVAAYGDAFSTRCTTGLACGSPTNEQHRTTGFWYVIKMPATGAAAADLNVFDAAMRRDADESVQTKTGDHQFNTTTFQTEFTVYRQTNPLDTNARVPLSGCSRSVTGEAAYSMQWQQLCQLPALNGGLYLLNVKTTGDNGAGINGYAVEAVASSCDKNTGSCQPALFALGDMGLFNNNSCEGTGCTPPPSTFYLAEVGPQFAGRSLVIELWDAGDAPGATIATLYPRRPVQLPASQPTRPRGAGEDQFTDVPALGCEYMAYTEPNEPNATSQGWFSTGAQIPLPQPSDFTAKCGVRTKTGSTGNPPHRFNDEWLQIRIDIPADYTCTKDVNPMTTMGSCWWAIHYDFSDAAYDVTTWQARIEGAPVHLTV